MVVMNISCPLLNSLINQTVVLHIQIYKLNVHRGPRFLTPRCPHGLVCDQDKVTIGHNNANAHQPTHILIAHF